MTDLLRLASEFEALAQTQTDPMLPESFDAGDALQYAQEAIRSWLHLYSVYPSDVAFVNALKVFLRQGKHTQEELQSAINTLMLGPSEHSPQAKAGWKSKVAPFITTLEGQLKRFAMVDQFEKLASADGPFEVLADGKVLYSGDDANAAMRMFNAAKHDSKHSGNHISGKVIVYRHNGRAIFSFHHWDKKKEKSALD